jgi:hypothetical protein
MERGVIQFAEILENNEALDYMQPRGDCHLAIEMVASYGMPVGVDVFETVLWIGRFIQAWQPHEYTKVFRKDVKIHLCNSMAAKDGNIRQALIDRYPATGGGKVPQVGIKSCKGELFGIKSHLWSALAVATFWIDKQKETGNGL